MSHFYLTLPSNSSMEYFPDNTLTNFTTKLYNEISLKDEWEMGLAEIIFPKKLFNVDENQHVTLIRYYKQQTSSTSYINFRSVSPVKAGYYDNVEDLTYAINNAMRVQRVAGERHSGDVSVQIIDTLRNIMQSGALGKLKEDPSFDVEAEVFPIFSYNQFEKKVRLELLPFTEVILSEDLKQILGFPSSTRLHNLSSTRKVVDSSVEINLDSNRQTFYIYCDILESVPVGDTVAPLLRTIDVEGVRGAMIHRNFEQPRYLPIQKKNFGTVKIDIRDGLGRAIPFVGDSLIVTLHLRRANLPYFLA